ncbi:excalibur calcium-binding domain-containing protein [Glycomyces luteolus]|uniref:Excalibur calcium-binding domain-containing protein n=1 Tax=Glycomyces luteolus TaxID=2670330 RepID=A0A9X3P7Q3_9ACTN|nr:excalibur calcium-binding domain-containing protein [Glycomyces luteolus]MDA1359634.1 excalibur calcium-binding domain-containing protein [Glycomyces luteolus]
MTLVLGVIATSPAGGERTHESEVSHDFELVDFKPLDTGDDEAMMEESDDGTSAETQTEEPEHGTSAETPTEETDTEETGFVYENCDAARAAGAAPVHEGEHGFGPHLDADNDGVGCENWSGPSQAPAPGSEYPNCEEARADGKTDIQEGEPGYAEHLDRDNDGVACES